MRYAILLLISSILFSCNAKKNTAHLSPDKMEAILQDLHIAESYSVLVKQDSLKRSSEKNYDSLALYYQAIFKHHNTSQKEFEQNFEWYKQNPEGLDSIYIRMIDSMVMLQNNFQLIKS